MRRIKDLQEVRQAVASAALPPFPPPSAPFSPRFGPFFGPFLVPFRSFFSRILVPFGRACMILPLAIRYSFSHLSCEPSFTPVVRALFESPVVRALFHTCRASPLSHLSCEPSHRVFAPFPQVNDTLVRLARERAFQDELKRPLVRVALDIWDGKGDRHPPADREMARVDEGFRRIFPRMKAFEKVCDAAKIKFPGDDTSCRPRCNNVKAPSSPISIPSSQSTTSLRARRSCPRRPSPMPSVRAGHCPCPARRHGPPVDPH